MSLGTMVLPSFSYLSTSAGLNIGTGNDTTNTNWSGNLSELILYTSALSTTNRQLVENSQSNFYTNGNLQAPSNSTSNNTLDKVGLSGSTPAAAAYSLRLLSSGYTGPLVRVLINNNYYDVYPDSATKCFSAQSKISAVVSNYNYAIASAGTNNLGSLITAGVTNATVSAWYDQSGNGRSVYQASASNQPLIISSGVINTFNGRPSLFFNGSNNYFQSGSVATWLNGTAYSIQAFAQSSGTTASKMSTLVGTIGQTGNGALHVGWRTNTDFTIAQYSDDADYTTPQFTAGTQISVVKNTSGGASLWINGSLMGTSAAPNSNLNTSGVLNIGCGYTPTNTFWNGSHQLCYVVSHSQSKRRERIRTAT
jgi:hypothetical protein